MTRAEVIRALNGEYSRLRDENLRKHEERVAEVLKKDASLKPLIEGGAALFQQRARLLLAHPEQAERFREEIRSQVKANDLLLKRKLKDMGYPEDYLQPIFRCAQCRDTGRVGGGVQEFCSCFSRRIVERMFDAGANDRRQTFETYNENVFPDDVMIGGYSQRQISLRIRNRCRAYAQQFPETELQGLVLMGESGLGKTFLLNCIENAVIERGYSPVKVTGYRMFEAMRGCHFNDAEKRAEFNQLVFCELLLIDDLGTEPMMQNITREYLFTLLNERLVNRRHTVIATNLSSADLFKVYGERVFSRLLDGANMTILTLVGRDLRLGGGKKP